MTGWRECEFYTGPTDLYWPDFRKGIVIKPIWTLSV